MKRVLIIMCMAAMGMGYGSASAQWKDDIYYSSDDIKREEEARAAREEERKRRREQQQQVQQSQYDENAYSDGSSGDYVRTYDSDDYIDYDDDMSYYSTNIRRFNYPFYNMGFYSSYYDPFWYNRQWVDPYWGWSWWARPGFSMGIGWGGPYWSSYWGWHTWYGYPGFYNGMGWGGYYSGYWNGYYAGMHHGDGWRGRTVNYGPRVPVNSNYTSNPRRPAPRTSPGDVSPQQRQVSSGGFQRRGTENLNRSTTPVRGSVRDQPNNVRSTTPVNRGGQEDRAVNPARQRANQAPANRTQPAPSRGQFVPQRQQRTSPAANPGRGVSQPAPSGGSRIINQRQAAPAPTIRTPSRSGSGGNMGGGSRGGFGGSSGGGSRGGSGGGMRR